MILQEGIDRQLLEDHRQYCLRPTTTILGRVQPHVVQKSPSDMWYRLKTFGPHTDEIAGEFPQDSPNERPRTSCIMMEDVRGGSWRHHDGGRPWTSLRHKDVTVARALNTETVWMLFTDNLGRERMDCPLIRPRWAVIDQTLRPRIISTTGTGSSSSD